jgi:LPXTG-site transpeptidase (sortase) family protein
MSFSVNRIKVKFNKDVLDLPGNSKEDDVTNPDNYILLQTGLDGIYNTQSCLEGLAGDDVRIPINAVTYDNEEFMASLIVNNSIRLRNGSYRLFICGTTSIVDSAGNVLNGGLGDFVSDFKIAVPPKWPLAGFSQNHVTILPSQPDDLAYVPSDMILSIPTIDVELPIMGVPLTTNNGWDVTWLGSSAGYLEGTAYPTWEGNTVITAHIWDALNQPGPFLKINTLQYGDRFYIHSDGQTYTYEVRNTFRIKASDINSLMAHENYDWVTLLTCESYDPVDDSYQFRRAVSAVLIEVE